MINLSGGRKTGSRTVPARIGTHFLQVFTDSCMYKQLEARGGPPCESLPIIARLHYSLIRYNFGV